MDRDSVLNQWSKWKDQREYYRKNQIDEKSQETSDRNEIFKQLIGRLDRDIPQNDKKNLKFEK